jgi:hypothetical protein
MLLGKVTSSNLPENSTFFYSTRQVCIKRQVNVFKNTGYKLFSPTRHVPVEECWLLESEALI